MPRPVRLIRPSLEPQTIDVMKQLRRFCPNVRITADRAAADFLILHERQAGGTFGGNRNNIAVFGKDDLLVYAEGTTQLDNSVKDLCGSGVPTASPGSDPAVTAGFRSAPPGCNVIGPWFFEPQQELVLRQNLGI